MSDNVAQRLRTLYLEEWERTATEAANAQEAQRQADEAARNAKWRDAEIAMENLIRRYVPAGVEVQWEKNQNQHPVLYGKFVIPGETGYYLVEFSARRAQSYDVALGDVVLLVKVNSTFEGASPDNLAYILGKAIKAADDRQEYERNEAKRREEDAEEHARYDAADAARRWQNETDEIARNEQRIAEKAAKRSAKLTHRVAEVEAMARVWYSVVKELDENNQ